MELTQASRQWSTRPDDERFISLHAMADHFADMRAASREVIAPSRALSARPAAGDDMKGIEIISPNGHAFAPTHYAFGQLAQRAGAPAGYLRSLPAPIASDCVNYGLKFERETEDLGLLLYRNGTSQIRAATGPRYGRIWNDDVVSALVSRFGDGVSGDWRVPGEFGRAVDVTKANTTLYAGDRDMFVFLADEERRISMPNRRDGKSGDMAREFFVWNSEVGSSTFGLATFLFDYVCCNRIVWGAAEYKEIKIRHTSGAPERFLTELQPALAQYARSSDSNLTRAIEDARSQKLVARDGELETFLAERFGRAAVAPIQKAHELAEGRPVESRWAIVVGATQWAQGIRWQDERVAVEREAGKLLTA
jgi:hypothetical protein